MWQYLDWTCCNVVLILKTIGNRKGDCAWSCSRWQTQPEKICKSQRTNQCHSLRTLYWFVRCDLQIFSGCVCHLEQLHAQSPFLFPIVFSINLIPFFDICSVDNLLFFHPGCSGMCCFTWAAARSQQLLFVVLAAGILWFTAGCHVKSPLFPQPPLKQQCAPRWVKAWDRRLFTIQRSPRISTSWKFTAPRYRLPCRLFRWASNLAFQQHWKIAQSCRSHKDEVSAISATTFATALSLSIAHDGRKHKHNPTLSANKHVVQICRSSQSAAADGLADGSGERRTSPVNGIERSLSRAVVPKTTTKSLPVSATTFPTALSFYIAQGRLRKDIRPLSKLFSKAEPLPFEKEININLVYSSCLKHANEMLLANPREADQRKQSFPFPIVIHPAARALKRQYKLLVFSLYMHSSTRQAQNASTRRVDAPSR